MSESEARLAVAVGLDDHIFGSANAPITLVEYGDYECPYYGQAYPIAKELQRVFGGDLRFVFRNMPLANVHPHAVRAAEAAEAVGLVGQFWPMHDLLYEHQNDLEDSSLLRYAEQAGAKAAEIAHALETGSIRERVEADLEGGLRSGVNGTPTFFVNDLRYGHSWDFDSFREYLQAVPR